MAKMFRPRRGTTAANAALVGGVGELTVDISKGTIRVHDGSTAGGTELARMSDIAATITKTSQLINDSGYITSTALSGVKSLIEFYNGYMGSSLNYLDYLTLSEDDCTNAWNSFGNSYLGVS